VSNYQKENNNKQIAEVNLPKTDTLSKKSEKNQNYKNSSPISVSDEFLLFWGNNLDSSWFEGKSKISPFLIIILLLIGTILYLCSSLLFSPSEIEQALFESVNTKKEKTLNKKTLKVKKAGIL